MKHIHSPLRKSPTLLAIIEKEARHTSLIMYWDTLTYCDFANKLHLNKKKPQKKRMNSMYFSATKSISGANCWGWRKLAAHHCHKIRIISFHETTQKPYHKAFPPLSKITHFPKVWPMFSYHCSHKARESSPLLTHNAHQSWTSKFPLYKVKKCWAVVQPFPAMLFKLYLIIQSSLTLPKALHHKVYCMLLHPSFWGGFVLGTYKHYPSYENEEFMI